MDQLPFEILFQIFEQLSYGDKCSLRQVSTYFNHVLSDKYLSADEELIIDTIILNKNPSHFIDTILQSHRIFHSWAIIKIETFDDIQELFEKLGHNITHLKIDACEFNDSNMTTIISCCTVLESLSIISCGAFDIIPIPIVTKTLKTLTFANIGFLTDSTVYNILKIFPEVQHLSFHNSNVNFHAGIYYFYYEHFKSPLTNLSTNVLTSRALYEILAQYAKNLKSLDLGKTKFTDQALKQFSKMPELQLKLLNIAGCNEIKRDTLTRLSNWQEHLVSLNISHIHSITDSMLQDLCFGLRNLEYLNCSHLRRITNRGVIFIKFLVKLVDLDISHCYNVTTNAVLHSLCSDYNYSIKKLNIAYLGYEYEVISEIADRMPNLTELIVTCIGWHDLHYIYKHHKQLIRLDVACKYNQNFMVTGVDRIRPDRLRRLQYTLRAIQYEIKKKMKPQYTPINWEMHRQIILTHCYDSIDGRLIPETSIGNLINLQYLNLSSRHLSNEILYTGFYFPHLKVLKLVGTKITTKGVILLVAKCPVIESLDLSETRLNNAAVEIITLGLKRLNFLYMKSCKKITDDALMSIYRNAKSLKVLDIEDCSEHITKKMIDKLLELPFIREVRGRPYENATTLDVPVPPPLPI